MNGVAPSWIQIIIVVLVIAFFALLIWSYGRILNKAGYSRWWSLIMFVPLVNVVMVWVFAFANWPRLGSQRVRSQNVVSRAPQNGPDEQRETSIEGGQADGQEAQLALQVKTTCEIAAMSARAMKTDVEDIRKYELERYAKLGKKAINIALSIDDEFYRSATVHSVIKLCQEANDIKAARSLFKRVEVDFMREQILEDWPELATG